MASVDVFGWYDMDDLIETCQEGALSALYITFWNTLITSLRLKLHACKEVPERGEERRLKLVSCCLRQ